MSQAHTWVKDYARQVAPRLPDRVHFARGEHAARHGPAGGRCAPVLTTFDPNDSWHALKSPRRVLQVIMYQPQVPLITMSPGFRTAQLAELELGHLVLLRPAADVAAAPGIGLRADALSAQGDLTVGVLRLRPTRFERCALDDLVIAIDLEYLLEADLTSATARAPGSGDLVVAARRPAAAGLYVANLWGSAGGLLDIASAVIRPFGAAAKAGTQVVLGWRLVEREQRTRTLFERMPSEPYVQELPRRVHGEDCD